MAYCTALGALRSFAPLNRYFPTEGGESMFDLIRSLIQSVREREEGQGLVEYALILSLVSIAAVGALTALGVSINGILGGIF